MTEVYEWLAQSLRVTVFLREPKKMDTPALWSALTDSQPEATVSRPALSLEQAEGPFHQGRLALVVSANRLDWQLTARPEQAEEAVIALGRLDDTLTQLVPLMPRFFKLCPPVLRMAFGAVLIQPARDRESAYRRLSKYLHSVQIDAEGSSEFFYRINRPRISQTSLPGVRLNRLSSWLTESKRLFSLTTGSPLPPVVVLGDQDFYCRLELDLSSAAERSEEISPDSLAPLLDELILLGREIAENGDIK